MTALPDRSGATLPGRLLKKGLSVLVPLLLAACSPLALVNSLVPTADLTAVRDIAYGSAERQRLDVYRPAAANGGAGAGAPVVVFFYGGSWQGGNRGDYLFMAEALAARGLVVVLPDYRVYPEVRFPGFMEDAAAAVRWVRDHAAEHGGDPKRIFLMGHSAGAHIAVLLSLDSRYLAKHAMEPGNVRGTIGLAGPYDFLPLSSERLKSVFGQDLGWELGPTQPITYADRYGAMPPFMLAHGSDDAVVYPRNTIRLAERLRAAGRPVRELRYDGVGHYAILLSFARPARGFASALDDTVDFIKSN